VPLIRHLLEEGHQVTVAGNESQRRFIEESFAGIKTIHLEGYNVRYSSTYSGFLLTLLSQLPRLLRTIRHEREWLEQQVKEHGFDGIISDNRYGLYHGTVPSVIITHQLQVQTGIGSFADQLTRQQHYSYLQRFSQCWIPDVPGKTNLGGTLSHPAVLPAHTKYIGLLSQMHQRETATDGTHLLVLLSGPEPQRSLLSDIIWQQLQDYTGAVVFVEGSSNVPSREHIPENISYHKRLTQQQLQPLIENASMVICRSGYSSLMDLLMLRRKAILIPTPGQTEQEYLAKHLQAQGVFLTMPQKSFVLADALHAAADFPFHSLLSGKDYNLFAPVMNEWLAAL
jgi:UDP-N-acetylglucosamine transferase subunit ALG13